MENLLALLVFAGIAGVLFFRKKDKKKRNVSAIISIVSFIIFGVFFVEDDLKESGIEDKKTQEVTQDEKSKNESDVQKKSVVEKSEKKDVEKTEVGSIFLQNGHPVFGGSMADAENYAKKFDKELITLKRNDWTEESIIHIPLAIDDQIRSIELYPDSLSVNDAELFDIIEAYLPEENMSENYEEPKYTQYLRDENDTKNANKLILYSLKEDAETSLGSLYIVIHVENDNVKTVQFTSSRPNSVSTRGLSSLTEEDWEPNFKR